jgi:serine/threonine protein phosphatase PrpC
MTQQEFQKRYTYNPTTDKLGEGGFGSVFKAYDNHLDRWVALKISKVNLENARLRKEVEMARKLSFHPNIARYEDCYTFSYLDGEHDIGILRYYADGNFGQLLQHGVLTFVQKQSILLQILDGIEVLHQNGIIHRDLKPMNILIEKQQDEYVPKITDFGISKQLDSNKSSVYLNSKFGWGTEAYSSPEQMNAGNITKNTDLWSFGVIAFETLTGQLPFNTGGYGSSSEAGRIELFRQIGSGRLPEITATIAEPWQTLIRHCLVLNTTERVKNGQEVKKILANNNEVQHASVKIPAHKKIARSTDFNFLWCGEKTDTGQVRKTNVDSMMVFEVANMKVFVVCDGLMNGEAAETAIAAIGDYMRKITLPADPCRAIYESIIAADEALLNKNANMVSTCVMLIVTADGKVYYGHVGNSRIYIVANHRIMQLTKDHSFVQTMVDAGMITKEQAEHHPRKNEITNTLGLPNMQPPTVCREPIEPEAGDCFLLCSDGLTDMVADKQIQRIISKHEIPIQQRATIMVKMANNNGGVDNITVELVEFAVGTKELNNSREKPKKRKKEHVKDIREAKNILAGNNVQPHIQCIRGHVYDSAKYGEECPFCQDRTPTEESIPVNRPLTQKKCIRGHVYDSAIYGRECPFCPKPFEGDLPAPTMYGCPPAEYRQIAVAKPDNINQKNINN